MTHVHLIGIGGSGLSAIARVLLERGDVVSGSDQQESLFAQDVRVAGARVYRGHHPENITGADLVIRSSAVSDDNVEVIAARNLGIPVLKRSEFLGKLMEGYQVIAVAGTHGKTTTTAMIAWLLTALNQDPSYIIGGVSDNLGTNAKAGQGSSFVVEADEYDRMFLGLEPEIAVITNVEHDHPDCYPTQEDFFRAFQQFVGRLSPDGILFGCLDDPQTRRLLQKAQEDGIDVRTYGFDRLVNGTFPDYFAYGLSPVEGHGFSFEAVVPSQEGEVSKTIQVTLQVPGRHNVLNSLAAIAVADELGLPLLETANIIGEFRGTNRRFDVRGEVEGITVIDDYAHHPTEIKATLSAARYRYPEHEIWTVWQPHTYSRTRKLFTDFVVSFNDADHLMVTDVYAAREVDPTNGFSSKKIVDAISHPDVQYVSDFEQAVHILTNRLGKHDILIVLSAGDADQISTKVLEAIQDST
jgi:UDP-N-acetylmuramate--alanine ligase